ncbi:hypothetical protein G6O69_38520 [Pseudenhygromyxa sp. WMMC2535]|uniref:hypothetical protein n=1 Tax=Pseudenhygromyxa sp. WMMC2535 TaxID=2712867 RepID=UPI001595B9CD|nr:hypothetical protein [Pseudenhygromyxa sp. WMMC2535]NVB43757.1 hypothetical protein [Pseudenhygromyxa sp. WMMC2535]
MGGQQVADPQGRDEEDPAQRAVEGAEHRLARGPGRARLASAENTRLIVQDSARPTMTTNSAIPRSSTVTM